MKVIERIIRYLASKMELNKRRKEFMCLLLRWPYGQSTIGSHYELTTFIQVRATKTILTWDGMGEGGGWWWETGGWQPIDRTVR